MVDTANNYVIHPNNIVTDNSVGNFNITLKTIKPMNYGRQSCLIQPDQ